MLAALKDGLDRCLREPDAHSTATRAERQDGGNARSVGLACPGGLWTQRSARAGQGRGTSHPDRSLQQQAGWLVGKVHPGIKPTTQVRRARGCSAEILSAGCKYPEFHLVI